MELLKTKTNIDFMGQRKLAIVFSSVLLLVSLASFGLRGLNYGIDFTGGTLIEVSYPESADLVQVRTDLAVAGFPGAIVQYFGTTRDVLVRLAPRGEVSKAELSSDVLRVLKQNGGDEMQLRRVEFVGPQVGEELTEQGGLAMLVALGAILVYVSFRFQWKFSLGAVAALFHDVLITIGFFSLLGLEFDLTVLAAVLAVIGYSLNDTIVVFDRVRENFRTMRKGTPVQIFNSSLNQTLSRTLITSMTTLLVLGALFFLGGELIHEFATALIVGVIIGTYSSIYVASTSALALGVMKADFLPVQKEGAGADARP
ncbi:MAG: protein translocase subunit SecF [Gammaproteobacteria bacterium]|nr:MAG: protein translocase subunit SecF [Gammaproteobacteria bacterium]